MPRRYRCIVLATVGWLILAATPSSNNGSQAKQPEPSRKVEQALASIANSQAEAVEQAKPGEYQRPCNPEQDNRASELCAQWEAAVAARESARWAFWSFLLGIAGTSGLLVTLYYTREAVRIAGEATKDADAALAIATKNADAATEHVRIAADTAKRQLQAYLEINKGRVRFRKNAPPSPMPEYVPYIAEKTDDPIEMEVIIENTGQTPAYNLIFHYEVILWSPTGVFPKEQAMSGYQPVANLGKSFVIRHRLLVSPAIWNALIAPGIAVTLLGKLKYEDAFGDEISQEIGIGYWPHASINRGPPRGNPRVYSPWEVDEWMDMDKIGAGGNYV